MISIPPGLGPISKPQCAFETIGYLSLSVRDGNGQRHKVEYIPEDNLLKIDSPHYDEADNLIEGQRVVYQLSEQRVSRTVVDISDLSEKEVSDESLPLPLDNPRYEKQYNRLLGEVDAALAKVEELRPRGTAEELRELHDGMRDEIAKAKERTRHPVTSREIEDLSSTMSPDSLVYFRYFREKEHRGIPAGRGYCEYIGSGETDAGEQFDGYKCSVITPREDYSFEAWRIGTQVGYPTPASHYIEIFPDDPPAEQTDFESQVITFSNANFSDSDTEPNYLEYLGANAAGRVHPGR
ncbi:MAG: hypothetical protein HQ596_08305 [Candidatus Saganbacteria bacterium]|nr:hypothetical protein [Candidatus Saganbacteria bacterium]